MPKIDLAALPRTNKTGYPPPHDAPVNARWYTRLGPASGLSAFAASHVVLKPGAWSSQRHWHHGEDEMVVMLAGEAVLIEDGTRTILQAGDIATFPMGAANGHHLINESDADCCFVAISAGTEDGGEYSDIDMLFTADDRYVRRDGSEYPTTPR